MNYYYDSILKAADFIEKNLTSEMDLSKIIKSTGFSQFHFMRIFKAMLGYTINDYVRRRKITEAAKKLIKTDMKIIDIAILYGYNSQEAFTRAFKEVFNLTPNAYRANSIAYKNLEQLVLTESLLKSKAGGELVEPVIIERESFIIAGLEYKGRNNNYEVPKLWNEFGNGIYNIPNRVNQRVTYGFEDYDESASTGNFRYLASVEVNSCENMPRDLVVQQIESSRYAVFPIKAVIENVPNSISKIYSTHIPNSGLRIKGNYDFEYYNHNFKSNREESVIYFYVPIEG